MLVSFDSRLELDKKTLCWPRGRPNLNTILISSIWCFVGDPFLSRFAISKSSGFAKNGNVATAPVSFPFSADKIRYADARFFVVSVAFR